jgi:protein required for attachment to host cells
VYWGRLRQPHEKKLTGIKKSAHRINYPARVLEVHMNKIAIPRNTLVFVGDGQRALFLRNIGDEKYPNLKTERVFTDDNPPTHEQGTDRPGRGIESAGTHRHSSVEPTDWHEIEKHRFADRVAAALDTLVHAQNIKKIVVVAPPRTLAELRHAFHADVKACIIAEIDKDLTKHPVWEIEKHIFA